MPIKHVLQPPMNDSLRRNRLAVTQGSFFKQNSVNPRPPQFIQYPKAGDSAAENRYICVDTLLAHARHATAETLTV